MKKKILIALLVFITVLCASLAFTGCCMEHQWAEQDTPATCTERGIRGSVCTKCGYYTDYCYFTGNFTDKFKIDYIDPLGHNYVPEETPATETEKGYVTMSCSRCEENYRLTHTPAVKNTCKSDGNVEYYQRSYDGKYFTDLQCEHEITLNETRLARDPDAHVGNWNAVKRVTCTEDGKEEFDCTVEGCGYHDTRTVPALGHDLDIQWIWSGNESAMFEAYCRNDAAHTYNVNVTAKVSRVEPTCTEDGRILHTVSVDVSGKTYSDSKSEPIAALGHNIITAKAVEANCEHPGKTEGSHCSRCDYVVVEQQTIPQKEHTDKDIDGICDVCEYVIESVFSVSTENELRLMINDLSATYKLTKDIVLTSDWEPLGTKDEPFTGKLYGNGHYIQGLKFSSVNFTGGLFVSNQGLIDGVTLRNLTYSMNTGTFANTFNYACGGFAGTNSGTIANCTVEGVTEITGYCKWTLVGSTINVTFNCGAVCGINSGTIENCQVTGTVAAVADIYCRAADEGGIALGKKSTINATFNYGSIAGTNSGTITGSHALGDVTVTLKAEAAVLFGRDDSYVNVTSNSGAFVGNNGGNISECSSKKCEIQKQMSTPNTENHPSITVNDVQRYSHILGANTGTADKLNLVL